MSKTIIKFGAEWCGPCKAIKPQMDKFKELIQKSDTIFVDVDVDSLETMDMTTKYKVRSIPYIVFLKDEIVEKTLSGMKTADELYKTFKEIYEN